jgi:septum formation protein
MLITRFPLILGSASPRRKELMEKLGLQFEVLTSDVDEIFPACIPSSEVAGYLAKLKWDDLITKTKEESIVITSDTVVVLDGKIYGKPSSLEDAKQMLAELSGKSHEVITAVCIGTKNTRAIISDISFVSFKELSSAEIDYYVNVYKPLDKAAAYGIQEWIGMIGINQLKGSFFTVMGFPVDKVYQELLENWT